MAHNVGKNIYDYSKGKIPILRDSVHLQGSKVRDLGGLNALLSNHFYYFGEEARPIPYDLKPIIKHSQGHLVIRDKDLIAKFEKWIGRFKKNKLYASPQLQSHFDKNCKREKISLLIMN